MNNGSPFCSVSCVKFKTALNTIGCFLRSCLYVWFRAWNFLILLLTVSWRDMMRSWRCLFTLFGKMKKISSRYPLSAKVFSPTSTESVYAVRANVKSGWSPQVYPPCFQTISPVWIFRPISYRKPGALNLWLYHFVLKGFGSFILKSTPSKEQNAVAPAAAPIFRFSQII